MKGLLGIWLVICVCACTSKDVCHVQGRIKGIKDDVEIAVFLADRIDLLLYFLLHQCIKG